MTGIIDFHTHAFADAIAARAITSLEQSGNITAFHNGTIAGLLRSMDRAAISASVICSIATRPQQYQPILDWSKAIRSERIIPLPSLHPADPLAIERLQEIHALGFIGIKLHPYYQDFFLDDQQLLPLYRAAAKLGLLVVVHTGFDIAYPRIRRCDPCRVINILETLPELRLITTHLGGWDDWEEVRTRLIGRPVYMELSLALDFLEPELVRRLLLAHPTEYLLFGSDAPWSDQQASLDKLRQLELPSQVFAAITEENAARLLGGKG